MVYAAHVPSACFDVRRPTAVKLKRHSAPYATRAATTSYSIAWMPASTGGKYVEASAYGNRTLHTVSSFTSDGGSFPELRTRSSSTDPIDSASQKRHFDLAIGSNIHDASLQSQIPKVRQSSEFFLSLTHNQLRRQLSGAVAADIRRTVDAISSRDPSNCELAGSTAPKYFKYSKSGGERATAQSRVIKLHEVVSDPLEPAHVKLKKARCLYSFALNEY